MIDVITTELEEIMKLSFKTLSVLFLLTGLFGCGKTEKEYTPLNADEAKGAIESLLSLKTTLEGDTNLDDNTKIEAFEKNLGDLKAACGKFKKEADDTKYTYNTKKDDDTTEENEITAEDVKKQCKEGIENANKALEAAKKPATSPSTDE